MKLTIVDVCERLGVDRSTLRRWRKAGRLVGAKRHPCGTVCTRPDDCRGGRWEFTEEAVQAALQPSETGL